MFCSALDDEDWDLMRGLLHPDVVWSSQASGTVEGRDQVIANQRASRARLVGARHHVSNMLITVSDRTATAVSYVQGNDVFRDRPAELVRIIGTYRDNLELGNDGWVITRRHFERLWLDPH